MLYFDTAYLVRLYIGDPGWEKVRALAGTDRIACSLRRLNAAAAASLGSADELAACRQQTQELLLAQAQGQADLARLRRVAYEWLPLSPSVLARLLKVYSALPATVQVRAADALHLASAAENGLRDIYSNDARLLAAASYFGIKSVNIL